MNLSHSNSFVFNSSMSKKSKKTSFNTTKKRTVVNIDLSRSILNQTAKFRTMYKKIKQVNMEFAAENAKLKIETRNIIQENNLLRQSQVFGAAPSDKMKPLLDRASTNLMAVVDDLCSALALCNGKQSTSHVPEETTHSVASLVAQELEKNSVPNVEEPKAKKFYGEPKQKKDFKFDLLEPIDEHNFSEILSDISDLPELLFVEQDNKTMVENKNKKSANKRTETDLSTSSKFDNTLKLNDQAETNCASVSTSDIQETSECTKVGTILPFIAQSQKPLLKIVSNCLEDDSNEERKTKKSRIKEFALNMLGEEIQLSPALNADSTIPNITNCSACDMELTEVINFAPIVENSPLIYSNAVPMTIKVENEKTAQILTREVTKRSFNETQSLSESDKETDPDFVPDVGKRSKCKTKANKNFTFFDTKTKKVAPKSKSTRGRKKAEAKNKEMDKEPRTHDIFDLSSSFNKTSSFIKPYSPRPKKDLSNPTNTCTKRLSEARVVETDSVEREIEEPKTRSRKSRVSRRKTETAKLNFKDNSDSNSDQENGKTPDTIVKKTISRTKTIKKYVTDNTKKSSNVIENHLDQSPIVTPFVSKENIEKAKKKLKLTRSNTKSKVKSSYDEKDEVEKATISTTSRESIQYDPSLPTNLRSSNGVGLVETDNGITSSGRPRRGQTKSYKAIPLNKKMRRGN